MSAMSASFTARALPARTLAAPRELLRPPRAARGAASAGLRGALVCQAASVQFAKYQGLGNDFILVDNRDAADPKVTPEQAKKLCDRNFGIGGDGVIFALPPNAGSDSDYGMRIFNSDGSEPEMCGNGIRCLARFVADVDNKPPATYKVDTLAGLIQPSVRKDGYVAVDMGEPIFEPAKIPTTLAATQDGKVVKHEMEVEGSTWTMTLVSMGNPHNLIYAKDGEPIKVWDLPLEKIGGTFETLDIFPAKTNTEFVEVVNRGYVKMRVWERGAGITLACGTGACATVVAGVLEGRLDRECVVELPGGPLEIHWRESDNRIIMTGPAEPVFSGVASM